MTKRPQRRPQNDIIKVEDEQNDDSLTIIENGGFPFQDGTMGGRTRMGEIIKVEDDADNLSDDDDNIGAHHHLTQEDLDQQPTKRRRGRPRKDEVTKAANEDNSLNQHSFYAESIKPYLTRQNHLAQPNPTTRGRGRPRKDPMNTNSTSSRPTSISSKKSNILSPPINVNINTSVAYLNDTNQIVSIDPNMWAKFHDFMKNNQDHDQQQQQQHQKHQEQHQQGDITNQSVTTDPFLFQSAINPAESPNPTNN